MIKVLQTQYHSQRKNELFPMQSCGTTCVADYMNWINDKYGKSYTSDDDTVFKELNSDAMKKRALFLSQNGYPYLKDYLNDIRPEVDGIQYNHLNNVAMMLAEVASYLSFYEFEFKVDDFNVTQIKDSIDNAMPIIINGKYPGTNGHYISVVGYDDHNNFICDDPYGNFYTNYADANGAKMDYKISDLLTYGGYPTTFVACIRGYYRGNLLGNTASNDKTPFSI